MEGKGLLIHEPACVLLKWVGTALTLASDGSSADTDQIENHSMGYAIRSTTFAFVVVFLHQYPMMPVNRLVLVQTGRQDDLHEISAHFFNAPTPISSLSSTTRASLVIHPQGIRFHTLEDGKNPHLL